MHTYRGSVENDGTGMRIKKHIEVEIGTDISERVGQALLGPSTREYLRRA